MCGIVGYIGNKDLASVILIGLERLEYRGYDSCGIAAVDGGALVVRKTMPGACSGLRKFWPPIR